MSESKTNKGEESKVTTSGTPEDFGLGGTTGNPEIYSCYSGTTKNDKKTSVDEGVLKTSHEVSSGGTQEGKKKIIGGLKFGGARRRIRLEEMGRQDGKFRKDYVRPAGGKERQETGAVVSWVCRPWRGSQLVAVAQLDVQWGKGKERGGKC